MWYLLILVLVFVVVIAVLEQKTSRPDGEILRVNPYRRIMYFMMGSTIDATVYFDDYIDATELLKYAGKAREKFQANMTHCIVAAVNIGIAENPKMNRFVKGERLYARKGRYVTFSMKREKLNRKAVVTAVKMGFEDDQSFKDFCDKINGQINLQRSGRKTYTDGEVGFFNKIPRTIMSPGYALLKAADYFNLLPASFMENDPFYTSAFVANLGSLDMRAGYHHLYTWGTCPLFIMAGKIEDRPVVRDGKVVVVPTLHLRYTFDERVDDGLNARFGFTSVRRVLEDPFHELGCLEDDGSDKCLLGPHEEV